MFSVQTSEASLFFPLRVVPVLFRSSTHAELFTPAAVREAWAAFASHNDSIGLSEPPYVLITDCCEAFGFLSMPFGTVLQLWRSLWSHRSGSTVPSCDAVLSGFAFPLPVSFALAVYSRHYIHCLKLLFRPQCVSVFSTQPFSNAMGKRLSRPAKSSAAANNHPGSQESPAIATVSASSVAGCEVRRRRPVVGKEAQHDKEHSQDRPVHIFSCSYI